MVSKLNGPCSKKPQCLGYLLIINLSRFLANLLCPGREAELKVQIRAVREKNNSNVQQVARFQH